MSKQSVRQTAEAAACILFAISGFVTLGLLSFSLKGLAYWQSLAVTVSSSGVIVLGLTEAGRRLGFRRPTV